MATDGITLTSYYGERQRLGGRPAGKALAELYGRREAASSVLFRSFAIAVGAVPQITGLAAEARNIDPGGVLTMRRAWFLSGAIEPVVLTGGSDAAVKLAVYLSRGDTVFGVPAFEVMCDLLHRRGVNGATALAGLDGMVPGRRPRGRFSGRHTDAPVLVVAVGGAGPIGSALPELGDLVREPRMTLSPVQICKRDGQLISEPARPAPGGQDGDPIWQQLTVYASAATRHHGQPLHQTLVRRLRSAGVSVTATQPGIWGFRGDRLPHGGHHAPTVTTALDTAVRVPAAFGVIDELTREHGLVTCEDVTV